MRLLLLHRNNRCHRRRRYQYLGVHLFASTTPAHAAHRAGIQVIQAHRQFQVPFRTRQFIGHVEAVPGVIQPGFGPGVAGQVFAVFAVPCLLYTSDAADE